MIPALAATALLASASHGLELVASSFGGCGNSGSASYATAGTSDPSGARPVGNPKTIVCPGPLVAHYRPVIAGTPRALVLQGTPGAVTLMAIPDVPGWMWTESSNFASWSPVPGGDANPVVVPTESKRRFFRLENPELP